ncbi:MAG: pyruvate, water dikinase regulatory protein [Candidatus Puniceispirillales bacterium]
MNKIYNEKKREITIHFVSDSTGETIDAAVVAVIAQFPEVKKKEFFWPMVRSIEQINDILENTIKNPGIVVYSILNDENRKVLEQGCSEQKLPFISPLDTLFETIKNNLSITQTKIAGSQHRIDENYLKKVTAFEYAMQHDDGQKVSTMNEADIILVGVSRTSKTPTSIYLANKGLKVGNIPLVSNTKLPEEVFTFNKPLIVGLIKDPRSLMHIRQTRLKLIGENHVTQYADINSIKLEIIQARKIFTKYAWPTIDVSRRSVEETSAAIIQIYNQGK